jgi:predicted anti-sigma-YlaC factor YlaD
MIFECHDLERALANPELLAEAHKHLRDCEACRNEYQMWNQISSTAKQLHSEWESPNLWPEIRRAIEAERPTPKRMRMEWKLWAISAAAAAAVVLFAIVHWPQTSKPRATPESNATLTTVAGQDFLTEQALKEVQKNETAYRHSIDELSRLAQPKLENSTSAPILASYREKLLMLDSAILETQSNVSQNQFNVRLQTELADLYRQKRQTLQEVLTHGRQN